MNKRFIRRPLTEDEVAAIAAEVAQEIAQEVSAQIADTVADVVADTVSQGAAVMSEPVAGADMTSMPGMDSDAPMTMNLDVPPLANPPTVDTSVPQQNPKEVEQPENTDQVGGGGGVTMNLDVPTLGANPPEVNTEVPPQNPDDVRMDMDADVNAVGVENVDANTVVEGKKRMVITVEKEFVINMGDKKIMVEKGDKVVVFLD